MRIRLHAVSSTWGYVFDEAQAKRPSSVVVTLKLRNGGLCSRGTVETNNTGSSRSSAGFILNLSLFDLADRREELNQIFITGRPRKLMRRLCQQQIKR